MCIRNSNWKKGKNKNGNSFSSIKNMSCGNKFWHFCGHQQSGHLFCQNSQLFAKTQHAMILYRINWVLFFEIPILSNCLENAHPEGCWFSSITNNRSSQWNRNHVLFPQGPSTCVRPWRRLQSPLNPKKQNQVIFVHPIFKWGWQISILWRYYCDFLRILNLRNLGIQMINIRINRDPPVMVVPALFESGFSS